MRRRPKVVSKPNPKKVKNLFWIVPLVLVVVMILVYVGISVYGAYAFAQVPNRITSFKSTPADYGLTYEEVNFPSAAKDHLTMRGWWIPNPASDKAIIVVHGREQSRMERLYLSKDLWNMGYNLLLFDLRGHGASDGNLYFYGQYESWDTVGAFSFVKNKGLVAENVGLYGVSMGAAASLLALGHSSEIKTVFSDSSYADFGQLATERMPIEKGLPAFFLPGIFMAGQILLDFNVAELRPEQVLRTLHDRRIFLVHSKADAMIPVADFYRLKEAGGNNIVGSWLLEGADHTQGVTLYQQEYLKQFETFFKASLGKP
ncbi:MAG: alpha/beta hydrolase [Chloroflexota bacterium]